MPTDRQARERRQRRADHMQPGTVREARVRPWVGLVQAPPGHRDRPGGERAQLRLRGEPGRDALLVVTTIVPVGSCSGTGRRALAALPDTCVETAWSAGGCGPAAQPSERAGHTYSAYVYS